jgi:hypothetical protein
VNSGYLNGPVKGASTGFRTGADRRGRATLKRAGFLFSCLFSISRTVPLDRHLPGAAAEKRGVPISDHRSGLGIFSRWLLAACTAKSPAFEPNALVEVECQHAGIN